VNVGRAFMAGVAGGAVMSIGMAIGRALGMPGNVEQMMGTMFVPPGTTAFLLGLFIHLMVSGLIALIYAWGFEHVTHRAGFLVGLGFAVVHTVIAGIVMGMMPMMHPMIPERMPPPGFFMANLGAMAAIAEVVLHLIYGAIVGGLYGPVRIKPFAVRS
jgi:hypothetical protein